MPKFIAYYRVSTKRQGQSGLGLEAQQATVAAYLRSVPNSKLVEEFKEIESGKHKDRPQLLAALASCRVHGAVLLIAKLDRLSRNLAFTSAMMESGVEFICCDNPHANRLTIHLLAAIAEHEALMISERTRAALAAAKRRGIVLGGDRGNCAAIARKGNRASAKVRSSAAQRRASDLLPVIEGIRAAGAASLREIAAGLNSRGIATAQGGQWGAVQVQRVLAAVTA